MIVTLLGLLISLFAYLIAFPQPHQRRFDIYALILSVHIMGAVAYWLLSFETAMDAFTYYRDPFDFIKRDPLESGTYFMVHLVQGIRKNLGGSFLDHFLFFQAFGMVGIAFLMRAFNDVADSLGIAVPIHVYLTLLLPGLHFWSAGIGKDAPMIMAVCLALWSSVRIHKRIGGMAVALIIMALIRPHVGAVAGGAIVAGLLFSRQLKVNTRIMLAPIALLGLVYLMARTGERYGLSFSADSFSQFVDEQQDLGLEYGSGADLQSLPLPLKIFSLMFRPLFFDVENWLHRASSIENLALMYICGYIVLHLKLAWSLARNVFFVSFSGVFAVVLIVLLSMVNYNIGLGQRQKMMAVPAVLLLYGVIYIYRQYCARAARAATQAPLNRASQVAPAAPA
jgi:hypothetical protein